LPGLKQGVTTIKYALTQARGGLFAHGIERAAALAVLACMLIANPALAQTTPTVDYSDITGAVSVTDTIAAIVTIGGVLALLAVAIMGVRKVLGMIRRG
jgi:hypothetical protein